MNMKKVLAAGVAATMAVSSLAAVASAEETRTFDLITTQGTAVFKPDVKGVEGIDPGDYYDYFAGKTFALANAQESDQNTNGDSDINWVPVVNELDFDYYIPFRAVADDASLLKTLSQLSVTIKGKKLASDGATLQDLTQTAKLIQVDSAQNNAGVAANFVLPVYVGGGPLNNAFVPERFVQIDSIEFTATASGQIECTGLDEGEYTSLIAAATSGNWDAALAYEIGDEVSPLADTDDDGAEDDVMNTWVYKYDINGYRAARVYISLADPYVDDVNGYNDNGCIAYFLTGAADADGDNLLELTGTAQALADIADGDGLDYSSGASDGGYLISAIESMLKPGIFIVFKLDAGACSTTDTPAWLPMTDQTWPEGQRPTYNSATNTWSGGMLTRNDIWRLSDTNDFASAGLQSSFWGLFYDGVSEFQLDNQTYTVVDYNKGTVPRGFSGLASQVADFFNLQKNGKIEFVFDSYAPATTASSWKNGGIPSTEVGLRNFLEAAEVKDFALFVNYNSSTGSLQSNATLDETSGSVIFDISNILQDMGGFTKGNVTDIYYGLGRGVDYAQVKGVNLNQTGIWVSKIVLSFDADAAVSGDAATKDDEKEEEVKADDKGDVAPVADDDDEGEIEIADDTDDDDDDDSAIVIGDDDEDDATVVVTPDDDATVVVNPGTEKTPAGADENPHTGVALAVVPMIAAAAAMVISKKRK